MADFGKVLAAFVGGALVGVATALLLAPKSGAETRAQIAELARAKGLVLTKAELDAFVNRVVARVKDYFSDAEIEAVVDEAIKEVEAAKA